VVELSLSMRELPDPISVVVCTFRWSRGVWPLQPKSQQYMHQQETLTTTVTFGANILDGGYYLAGWPPKNTFHIRDSRSVMRRRQMTRYNLRHFTSQYQYYHSLWFHQSLSIQLLVVVSPVITDINSGCGFTRLF